MADDVLLNKLATIERCVKRAREEKAAAGAALAGDFTRQDAAVLNVQRACEAALDRGQHLIRIHRLGLPQSARDVFALLQRGGLIDDAMCASHAGHGGLPQCRGARLPRAVDSHRGSGD